MDILPGYATSDFDQATKHTEHGFWRSKTVRTRDIRHQTQALSSNFTGHQVAMVAGYPALKGEQGQLNLPDASGVDPLQAAVVPAHPTLEQGQSNLRIHGSNVIGEQQLALLAHNQLSISSAEEQYQLFYEREEKKSGIFGTGGSLCIGSQTQCDQQRQSGTRQHGSTVGSLQGDLLLRGQQHYYQLASQGSAPEGSIQIAANKVDILPAYNQQQLTQRSSFKRSGFSAGISNPLMSGLQTGQQLTQALSHTDNPRMQALAAAAGGLAAKNTYDALKANPKTLGGVNFSFTIGRSESQSESQQSQHSAQPAQLGAGKNLTISALGLGPEEHLVMRGVQAQAGENMALSSQQQLQLLGAENRSSQRSSHSSSSHDFGASVGSSGAALTAGFSQGEGGGDGDSLTHSNTHLQAGQQLTLYSGTDTLIRGTVGQAEQISFEVGGDFTMESLQDSQRSAYQAQQIGGNLALGANSISGSINYSENSYHSNFQTVTEQTALRAGDLGFQGQVKGNTHLKGSIIASTPAAIENNANSLVTQTLTYQDIENQAEYDAQSIAISGGYSKSLQPSSQGTQALPEENGVGTNPQGQASTGGSQVPGSALAQSRSGFSATVPIVLNDSGEAHSTTRSGISNAAQTVTLTNPNQQLTLTGQTPEQTLASLDNSVRSNQESSNALAPIFNQQQIEANFQIASILNKEVGTFFNNRVKAQSATQQALKQEMAKAPELQDQQAIATLQQRLHDNRHWEMGGKERILVNALTLAAGSNISGSTGQFLQAATINTLQSLGAQQIKQLADSLESETARTALQGLLAATGAAAQGQNAATAAMGASASVVLNNLIEAAYGDSSSNLTPTLEQREARKNLVTTLIAGTTQALGGDAALANSAATIEMKNNYLHARDEQQRHDNQLLLRVNALPLEQRAAAQQRVDELNAKDQALDELLRNNCQSLNAEQRQAIRSELQAAVESYQETIPGTAITPYGAVYTQGVRKVERLAAECDAADNAAAIKAEREGHIQRLATDYNISVKTAGRLYDSAKALHTGAAIAGTYYGMRAPGVARMPKAPAAAASSTARAVAASSSSRAGRVAARESTERVAIQFGRVENQINHTFRHIESAGFNRNIVQETIKKDLSKIANSISQGHYNGTVMVDGVKIDYCAFKLPNGAINIGRITPPRLLR